MAHAMGAKADCNPRPYCGAIDHGWRCARAKGHKGKHIACCTDDDGMGYAEALRQSHELHMWGRETKPKGGK